MKKYGVLFFLASIALLVGCAATSSSRLIGQTRAPIDPAEVRIYEEAPRRYVEIAALDASSGSSFLHSSASGRAEAYARLREEAARVGANGVLLTFVAEQPTGGLSFGAGGGGISGGRRNFTAAGGRASFGGPIVRQRIQALAIYVSDRR